MNRSRSRLAHIRMRQARRGGVGRVPTAPHINGLYIGLSPTDASALGYGEFALKITPGWISYKMATGLKVEQQRIKRRYWRWLTPAEVASWFKPDTTDIDDVVGLTLGESGVSILFLRQIEHTASVYIVGMFGHEAFGPTPLFTPAEVSRGSHELAIHEIEQENASPGAIPRISNGGLAVA